MPGRHLDVSLFAQPGDLYVMRSLSVAEEAQSGCVAAGDAVNDDAGRPPCARPPLGDWHRGQRANRAISAGLTAKRPIGDPHGADEGHAGSVDSILKVINGSVIPIRAPDGVSQ